ncbi:hypothetical protein [uncultured Draconibacterium sp.]|uniref:hypothetical protein n=1 Tax=uncultured Draconibacterium sp. TaxID=1573823 RepID=UPI00321715F2
MTVKLSQRKRKLIQRFHIGLKEGGMMKQKPSILESFGVESSKELTEEELQHAIDSLTGEADKWRKRLIAAIFNWCAAINYQVDINGVKAIASRASGYKNFNAIPVSRLRDLYYGWIKKSRTRTSVADFKEQVLNHLEACN